MTMRARFVMPSTPDREHARQTGDCYRVAAVYGERVVRPIVLGSDTADVLHKVTVLYGAPDAFEATVLHPSNLHHGEEYEAEVIDRIADEIEAARSAA